MYVGIAERGKKWVFSLVRCLPFVKRKIAEETNNIKISIEADMNKSLSKLDIYYELPKKGRSVEEISQEAKSYFELGKFIKG